MHPAVGWIQFGIGICVFIFSGVAAVIKVTLALTEHEKKLDKKIAEITDKLQQDYNTRMDILSRVSSEKVERVYQRFDKYKDFTESTFVRKDMCTVLHARNATELAEVKAQVNLLSVKFDERIDELKNLIIKRQDA